MDITDDGCVDSDEDDEVDEDGVALPKKPLPRYRARDFDRYSEKAMRWLHGHVYRARKPLSPFFGGTQFVVEPEASRNTTREPAVPLRRPEKGKPSHFVDWVNRRRYASPNLKRGRQQISFILDQSFRRVSTPFPQIALLAATRFRDRTGTDLEISSSRLYHLEMASSASSEAPRRPSDTPKCFCGPNLAQGWHRIRSQQNAPIAAPHAAPSPPAQSSLRPAAASSYLPRRLPRAAHRRALRFSP